MKKDILLKKRTEIPIFKKNVQIQYLDSVNVMLNFKYNISFCGVER